ncbi:hypothetical protein WA026_005568 [Henosepilachna vigintioctopunctata]|uniref:Uncharacterized protein n=1 Tax=Henosepilachna vigintioctopunctata TaxID=420089 RepID=A0AAW1U250_9CUCU
MRYLHLVIYFVIYVDSKELPIYMRHLRCPLTHDFKECFIEKGTAAIPLIAKGDPEYNLPKMNPFEIPIVRLLESPSMALNLTNLKVYGLEELKIIDIEVDLKRRMFKTTLSGQNVTVVGEYSVDGKILIMPIKTKGLFSMYLKNGVYIATKIDHIEHKSDDIYYRPVFDPLEYNFEKVEFRLDSLFGQNEDIGNQVNKYLNNNWENLMAEFGPQIARILSKIITDIFDNLAAVVPVKYIFLDDPVFKF